MSTVYSFFDKVEVKEGEKTKLLGKCKPCEEEEGKEKLIARDKSSTSGMRTHLRTCHRKQYLTLEDKQAERDAIGRKIAKFDR